jgi:hypothetical protein
MTRPHKRTGASICGTTAAGIACPLRRAASALGGPERLVGYGFRHWIEGRRTGSLAPWQTAWSLYCGMFGPARAQLAVGALSDWVVAVERRAGRTIEVADARCPEFCRDECLAISMIAACQHDTCPAMRACTFALIESGQAHGHRVDAVAAPARAFADTMASLDQVLSTSSILMGAEALTPANRLPT